jgi:hypothetical protein
MSDSLPNDTENRPEWFAEFERKLVDLIRSAPGAQSQDVGACLTVLIPRGGGADNAVFGGLVTAREEQVDHMRSELLTAVVWALLADGVHPASLQETFEQSLGIDQTAAAFDDLDRPESNSDTVN